MLQIRHRPEATLAVPSQPNQLPMVGLADEVDRAAELRVIMFLCADLHPLDTASRPIDDLLERLNRPSFGRVVAFDARVDKPERNLPTVSHVMADLVDPVLLIVAEIQARTVHLERQWSAKFATQVFRVASQKRNVFLVAAIDGWILQVNRFDIRSIISDLRDARIVLPDLGRWCANVGFVLAGIRQVQRLHSGSHRQDVAGAEIRFENQFLHCHGAGDSDASLMVGSGISE